MGAEDAPDGGGEVDAAVEVREAAIGGEAAAAAEEAADVTTSIYASLMGFFDIATLPPHQRLTTILTERCTQNAKYAITFYIVN